MYKYFLIAALTIGGSEKASGQVQTQQYDVLHDDRFVGKMLVTKIGDERKCVFKLTFNASLSLVIKNMVIEGIEEASFEKGVLVYSKVMRKVNGYIKTDKYTTKEKNAYVAYEGNTKTGIPLAEITSNFFTLLFAEPVSEPTTYSDNLQRKVAIVRAGAHVYQVVTKNGHFNRYSYVNGACSMIEMNTLMLSLRLKRR
ncbi:DUF6134 family protein [Dyadobacter sp. 32]|uniref:DUF6134 family protein n=1 Tax=Dyadobacter sp. 32 TaxID=538966 RepID=UPI0011EDAF7D